MIKLEEISYVKIAENLNLNPTDTLLIGADLTRLALYCKKNGEKFNISNFIDSFQTILSNGTLVIPTYTDNLKDGDTFNTKTSKPNIGALAMAAFKKENSFRTSDPFHSFAVFGKLKNEFAAINDKSTFGENSAFALLKNNNAKMLMIDIPFNKNFTFVHYCEESTKVSWRKYKKYNITTVNYNNEIDKSEHQFYTRKIGYINHLDPLETIFEKENITTTYLLKSIPLKIFSLSAAYDRIVSDIKFNKGKNIHKFSFYELIRVIGKKIFK